MAFLALALVAGAAAASMQGFGIGSLHWIEAAVGGAALGLGVGLLSQPVKRAALARWVLAGSLVQLALTVAGAQCALCFLVGK